MNGGEKSPPIICQLIYPNGMLNSLREDRVEYFDLLVSLRNEFLNGSDNFVSEDFRQYCVDKIGLLPGVNENGQFHHAFTIVDDKKYMWYLLKNS